MKGLKRFQYFDRRVRKAGRKAIVVGFHEGQKSRFDLVGGLFIALVHRVRNSISKLTQSQAFPRSHFFLLFAPGATMNNVFAMPATLSFSKINAKDARIAGGKGASLGEMTQAGIPVPPEEEISCEVLNGIAGTS